MSISRNEKILNMRRSGKTLEEIGLKFNITRERVRQIIAKNGPEIETPNLMEIREREKRDELRAISIEISANWHLYRKYDFSKLAKEYNLTVPVLRRILTKVQHAYISANEISPIEKIWTADDCIQVLQEAATFAFPLTILEYKRLIESNAITGPTLPIFSSRFGSWSEACSAAGVETGVAVREYDSNWSDYDLIRIVRQFLWESRDVSWSLQNYRNWRQKHESIAPSIGSLRIRLGTWSEIRVLALDADLPEFDMSVFDTLEGHNA